MSGVQLITNQNSIPGLAEAFDFIGLGIDFTARDKQNYLKAKGLPWEKAKAFEGSAILSELEPWDAANVNLYTFELRVNGDTRQSGEPSLMINRLENVVSHLIEYFSLDAGDLLYTGTPAGVGKVNSGDHIEGFLQGRKLLDFLVT